MTLDADVRERLSSLRAGDVADFLVRAIPVLVKFFSEHSRHGVDNAMERLHARLETRFAEAERAIAEKYVSGVGPVDGVGRTDDWGSVFHKLPAGGLPICGQMPAIGHRAAQSDAEVSCPKCRTMMSL